MLSGGLSFLDLESHPISTLSDFISKELWRSPLSDRCPEILVQRNLSTTPCQLSTPHVLGGCILCVLGNGVTWVSKPTVMTA